MDLQETLANFIILRSDSFKEIEECKMIHGGKVIGHFLPDVPEEIIHASNSHYLRRFFGHCEDIDDNAKRPA